MNLDLATGIRRFLEHLEVEKNCSKLTIRNYQHYLEVLLNYIEKQNQKTPEVSDIDQETIRNFRLYLSRQAGIDGEMKIVTQGYYVIALRSFLKWLIKNDYEVMQPEKIDVPKNKDHSLKFLNGEQIERLLNQPLLSTKVGIRDRAILELLFSTGLRVSELTRLNRDQINLNTREFGVIGKGGKARVVYISKRAVIYVDKYLKTRSDKDRPLFIRYGGKKEIINEEEKMRLSPRSIERIVKHYVRLAKLPVDATPHTLRHSMATDLLQSGADIRSVQEMLGHKNIATTQIYTHVTNARLREIHDKFHSGNK
ncbi:MAG TPA: tyrosine-type recombinase/integrase [Candidatus Woesebacteria bacterium]|nr:tyrosine-type recombinase/integrase [Candidatus Woesebacteria bacterium]